jgi:hypothetical protein
VRVRLSAAGGLAAGIDALTARLTSGA